MDGSSSSKSLAVQRPSENNLAAIVLDQNLKVLLLTAANSGSGTTTSALMLAGELSRSSRGEVLLIDASLSKTNLTQHFGLGQERGFLDLVLSDAPPALERCIEASDALPFHFMPLGHYWQHKAHLAPQALEALFARLGERYRFVVIDGEAIYTNADTLALAALADGVVLVVRGEETRWEVAQAAVQRLTQANARLLGSVFNARRYYMPKWVYDNL